MDSQPIIDAWIFARGGSKGCPGKNIRLLHGRPLIAYSIDAGKNSSYIRNIFVSTDDPKIAEVAQAYGAIVPFMRPAELAQDASPEHKAWQHAVNWMKNQTEYPMMDIMVSLPTVAPLRTFEDVDAGIKVFLEGNADVVISVTEAARHPCFNMVKKDENGYVSLLMPSQHVTRRQDAPKVYDIAPAFYILNANFVLQVSSYLDGKVLGIEIDPMCGIDIDTELDFLIAETIFKFHKS